MAKDQIIQGNHIFISYSSHQRDAAFLVRDKLRDWGYEPWLDHDSLMPGTYWADDIDMAIKTCKACIGIMTPSAMASRFVTNEWDLAIVMGKPFIPLKFEPTEPHYKYLDIQFIDFTLQDKNSLFALLRSRLDAASLSPNESKNNQTLQDPYYDYLQQLYKRIDNYLEQKLIMSFRNGESSPEPIKLSLTSLSVTTTSNPSSNNDPLFALGGITPTTSLENVGNFWDIFEQLNNRILLLGDPGSGKTISLLQYTRDAIVKRRQNVHAPLPILGIVPTWNPSLSIADWISQSYGTPLQAKELITQGGALLFLDGLDELGESRPIDPSIPQGPTFDPRVQFLENLPFTDLRGEG